VSTQTKKPRFTPQPLAIADVVNGNPLTITGPGGEAIVVCCCFCGQPFSAIETAHQCLTKRTELPQGGRVTSDATREARKAPKARRNEFRTERDFTSAALKEVRKLPGVFVWRQNSGQRGGVRFGGEKGAPDLMGIVGKRGLFFGCELKQPGETTSLEQDAWHRLAIERGAMVWVATTLDEVLRPLVEALR